MCGICGIYNLKTKPKTPKPASPAGRSKLVIAIEKMTNQLIHRGPDDEGFYVDRNIALGHRRLSIIDLTKAGHQPMKIGDLIIVYNGEIYNYLEIKQELIAKGYRFKTRTDTEVILAAYKEWGQNCVHKFNGMWAFVIYDRQKDALFASRDRLGVKPFYYWQNNHYFVFASEPKAILAFPELKIAPNDRIIWDYLANGLVGHSQETFFQDINELPPGHNLIIKNKQLVLKKYWDLTKKIKIPLTTENRIKKFREIFIDAVRIRLRADVPIGTCLSGGLDSSAIVMVINKIMKEEGIVFQIGKWQKTFSAVYKDKEARYADESEFIKAVSDATNAQSFFTYPSGKDLVKEVRKLCYSQDEPFASTSMYAQKKVFELAAKQKIKVVLDGQGSDELLGGYLTFFDAYLRELLSQGKFNLFFKELKSFAHNQKKNLWKILGNFFTKTYLYPWLKKALRLPDFSHRKEYAIFNPEWLKKYSLSQPPKLNQNPFRNQSYSGIKFKALPSYLRYEDRNSMTSSVESRLPFLDYRLVEFTYNLPSSVKIHQGQTKWILRQALKDILPAKIFNRHDKMGFTVPEVYWLKNDLKNEVKNIFATSKFNHRGFIIPGRASELFEAFLAGKNNNYQLIWRLFNLEIWFRRFIDI